MSTRTMKRDHGFMILIHNRHHGVDTLNCKILLPKFNTWKQGQIERKKGSLLPFGNTVGRFLAKNLCHYSVTATLNQRVGNGSKH